MLKFIEYLKDPHLVFSIQQYFGISSKVEKNNFDSKIRANGTTLGDESLLNANQNKLLEAKSMGEEDNENLVSDEKSTTKNFVVNNWFWYYLFLFGTELGDELFYASFIPFWIWNLDCRVGRRFVLVWSVIMYIGQRMKDVICWPRPVSPPVLRLERKWMLEHGMPSTHCISGVSIPFSLLLFTMERYEYPFFVGLCIALLWSTVVCSSRLYFGAHSVLDVIAGIVVAFIFMIPLVLKMDYLDIFLLTSRWSPIILLSLSISLIVFYPKVEFWTPTRGETAVMVSVFVGIYIGTWANYQLGMISESALPPPYKINWPSYEKLGLMILRCMVGYSCMLLTYILCKSARSATLGALGLSTASLEVASSLQYTIALTFTYITFLLIGFNIAYLAPNTFKLLSIERPAFYTEL